MTPIRKVYLAARYSRFPEMQRYEQVLRTIGMEVTSRWIEGGHEMRDGLPNSAQEHECIRFANEDIEDLIAADTVICFTEPPNTDARRGGRHVEMGYALALNKRVIVIGYRENVFCHLPQVEFWQNFHDLVYGDE